MIYRSCDCTDRFKLRLISYSKVRLEYNRTTSVSILENRVFVKVVESVTFWPDDDHFSKGQAKIRIVML